MKTLEDERQGVITAYKLVALEILRIFFGVNIYRVLALSLHIESTDSMIVASSIYHLNLNELCSAVEVITIQPLSTPCKVIVVGNNCQRNFP